MWFLLIWGCMLVIQRAMTRDQKYTYNISQGHAAGLALHVLAIATDTATAVALRPVGGLASQGAGGSTLGAVLGEAAIVLVVVVLAILVVLVNGR